MPTSKFTRNSATTVLDTGLTEVYTNTGQWVASRTRGTKKILTVVFFLIGALFALYAGPFREGMRRIIDVIRNDRQHEQETISVDKVISCWLTNDASLIRATSSKHRSVLGLVNP